MHQTKDKIEPQHVQFIYIYTFEIDFVGKTYASTFLVIQEMFRYSLLSLLKTFETSVF